MRLISYLAFLSLVVQLQGLAEAQVDTTQSVIGEAHPQETTASEGPGQDEVISDPELESPSLKTKKNAATDVPAYQSALNGQLRLTLHSRAAVDLEWQDPRQEVFETTEIALLEAKVRRSERLRFEVGLRARYELGALEHDTQDAQAVRYNLDLVPTAGFLDVTVANGLALRVGYQTMHLGRFDAFSAVNILDAVDLRGGPNTMPEAVEFGQLAVRVDWDLASWLSLRGFYLPFFQANLINLIESDYAVLPSTEQFQRKALDPLFGYDDVGNPPGPQAAFLRGYLRSNLLRAAREKIVEDGFATFAPEPSLIHPQGAVSLTARGNAGEMALTAGTALERLPVLKLSSDFQNLLIAAKNGTEPASAPTSENPPLPIEVTYPRFEVLALDGATELGPIQVGFESAYVFRRMLYATLPNEMIFPARADLVQLGLRGEYAEESGWIVILEAFGAYTVSLPNYPGARWTGVDMGRYIYGVAGHVSWTLEEAGVTLETNAALGYGPSYFIAPRAQLRIVPDLYVELGAFLIGSAGSRSTVCTGDRAGSVGCIYNDIDHVFVGLRWLP
jgi:hypothetical protein